MNECGKSGEALEQIIEDMGTPKEIAEEFNQNLPKEERKAYTKTIVFRWIAIVIFVLLLLIAYVWWAIPKYSEFGSSGKFSQPVVEEKVKDVVDLLNQSDYVTLQEMSEDRMRVALTQETMEHAKAMVNDNWGSMQRIGTMYTAEFKQGGKLYAIAQVGVTYENVDVIYTISFDEDMKLAGVFMR
ncbi:MAG: DUF3887 domain-containing protein [Lachnospiraceae bacterium]|nr:DUF3887 domain-containing protein [Lachnospiraceae bacterium]